MLRFDTELSQIRTGAKRLDNISVDMLAMLEVDEQPQAGGGGPDCGTTHCSRN